MNRYKVIFEINHSNFNTVERIVHAYNKVQAIISINKWWKKHEYIGTQAVLSYEDLYGKIIKIIRIEILD